MKMDLGDKEPTTEKVVVDPLLLAKLMVHGARHPENEVGGLLLGRAKDALYVEELVLLDRTGSQVELEFEPEDYEQAADDAEDGQYIVGLAHTHPGFGVFLSDTDVETQLNGQELFPGYVSLVMDPFQPDGVDLGFFRMSDGTQTNVNWEYGEYTCNMNGKSSSTDGTKTRYETFTPVWAAAEP